MFPSHRLLIFQLSKMAKELHLNNLVEEIVMHMGMLGKSTFLLETEEVTVTADADLTAMSQR